MNIPSGINKPIFKTKEIKELENIQEIKPNNIFYTIKYVVFEYDNIDFITNIKKEYIPETDDTVFSLEEVNKYKYTVNLENIKTIKKIDNNTNLLLLKYQINKQIKTLMVSYNLDQEQEQEQDPNTRSGTILGTRY